MRLGIKLIVCLSNYHPGCYILVEHVSTAFTSIVAYVSNYILNISKQLSMQTLMEHVPLNGWFLLRQPIKDNNMRHTRVYFIWEYTVH